jgi:hypothetical protein
MYTTIYDSIPVFRLVDIPFRSPNQSLQQLLESSFGSAVSFDSLSGHCWYSADFANQLRRGWDEATLSINTLDVQVRSACALSSVKSYSIYKRRKHDESICPRSPTLCVGASSVRSCE